MAQGTPKLLKLLEEIDPFQPYGTELFNSLAKLTVSVAIEAVCLRYNFITLNPEVYLVQRSLNDTAYPGEWHCPGSVMRPGERFENVLDRLAKKEFGTNLVSARFIANINPSASEPEARGHFISVVYLCTLEKEDRLRGQWFYLDNLPEKTVGSHRKRIIPCALGAFVSQSSGT